MFDISKLQIPFVNKPPSTIAERKEILRQLKQLLIDNEERICKALYDDLRKSRYEALFSEILITKLEIGNLLSNLDNWAGEKFLSRTFVSMFDTSSVLPQPMGRVLVISSWNYPVFLGLMPLAGALAAGNAVVFKPSELAPSTEHLLAELLPQYIEESVLQVFMGGAEKTMQLLDENRFDHIFYTGGANAARSILAQVAKHLTPVTLELGGKSPVYVDASADVDLTAKRLIWAKALNAGQTCVAPDYVLCHDDVHDKFVKACSAIAEQLYGPDMAESEAFARIINKKHAARLVALLQNTKGDKVYGGKTDLQSKYIELTIVTDIKEDDVLMQEEIFGPILPIVKVNSSDEAINFVNNRSKPLTCYVYTSDKNVEEAWKIRTTSGSIVFNDSMMQMGVLNLPFGGVGDSGMGRYFDEASIMTFSNPRSVLDKSTSERINNYIRYPPYTDSSEKWARWALSKSDSCCIL